MRVGTVRRSPRACSNFSAFSHTWRLSPSYLCSKLSRVAGRTTESAASNASRIADCDIPLNLSLFTSRVARFTYDSSRSPAVDPGSILMSQRRTSLMMMSRPSLSACSRIRQRRSRRRVSTSAVPRFTNQTGMVPPAVCSHTKATAPCKPLPRLTARASTGKS